MNQLYTSPRFSTSMDIFNVVDITLIFEHKLLELLFINSLKIHLVPTDSSTPLKLTAENFWTLQSVELVITYPIKTNMAKTTAKRPS